MSEQLTDWFPGDVKPVRPGVYEVRGLVGVGRYSHWNGHAWGLRTNHLELADDWTSFDGGFTKTYDQAIEWRDLSVNPSPITDEQTDDHTGICLEH